MKWWRRVQLDKAHGFKICVRIGNRTLREFSWCWTYIGCLLKKTI